MIGRIKNVYIRRVVLAVCGPVLLVAAGVLGAAHGAYTYVEDQFDATRNAWRK